MPASGRCEPRASVPRRAGPIAERFARARQTGISDGAPAGAIAAGRDASQSLAAPAVRERAWRAPPVEGVRLSVACALCGEPVLKRRRRHCEACLPKARREHGLRRSRRRATLAARLRLDSIDVQRGLRGRAEAISEGHRRNRRWAREHPAEHDEVWFKREIVPKLDAFTLNESPRRRACRSQPARASGLERRCRIRGVGTLCES